MPDIGLLGELVYCAGWIGIGAAIMHTRRRGERREAPARLTKEACQRLPPAVSTPGEVERAAAERLALSADLMRLAEAAGESVPVNRGEERSVPAARREAGALE